jgi:hypothetical protein
LSLSASLTSSIPYARCGVVCSLSRTVDPFYDLSLDLPASDAQLKRIRTERAGDGALEAAAAESRSTGWFGSVLNYVGLTSPPLSLETCLHSFCTSDHLIKKDQYKCDHCKLKACTAPLIPVWWRL